MKLKHILATFGLMATVGCGSAKVAGSAPFDETNDVPQETVIEIVYPEAQPYNLANLPKPFVTDGEFDGRLVVGAEAPASHIISLTDIAISFQNPAEVQEFDALGHITQENGVTRTYDIGNKSYEITALVNDLTSQLEINGEVTDSMAIGDIDVMYDGTLVGITTPAFSPSQDMVSYFIVRDVDDVTDEQLVDGDILSFIKDGYTFEFSTDIGPNGAGAAMTLNGAEGPIYPGSFKSIPDSAHHLFVEGINADTIFFKVIPDKYAAITRVEIGSAMLDTDVDGLLEQNTIFVGTCDSTWLSDAYFNNLQQNFGGEGGCKNVINAEQPQYIGGLVQPDGTTTLAVVGDTDEDIRDASRLLTDIINNKR